MYDKTVSRCYQELGAKIVELACADYIDAQIIKRKGYISEKQYRDRLFAKAIEYGRRRYIWKDSKGIQRQKNGRNLFKCRELAKLIDGKERIAKAEADIRLIEDFFHGSLFALSMPNTDPDGLIRLLKLKAMQGERMSTGYPSRY